MRSVNWTEGPMERITPEMVDALDIEGLESVEAAMVYRMSEIDAQLAVADETDPDHLYWRGRAVYAKNKMRGQLVLVKHRLRQLRRLEHSRPRGNIAFSGDDPHSLLTASYDVLRRLAVELDGDISEEEQSLIDALQNYIALHPMVAKARTRNGGSDAA
jgi:hypothetical protein